MQYLSLGEIDFSHAGQLVAILGLSSRRCSHKAGRAAEIVTTWAPSPVPGAGHQRSRLAIQEDSGIRAYMKPGFPDPMIPVYYLALERIASHLAHELGMNIPPVQLGYHPEDSKVPVCFSVEAGAVRFDWAKVEADNPVGLRQKALSLIPEFAPTLALDAWLQVMDRKEEHLVYAEDEHGGPLGIYSLDYSLSMIHHRSWQEGRFEEPYDLPHVRALLDKIADRNRIWDGVKAIQSLDQGVVAHVVETIPKPFLQAAQRRGLIQGLRKRQEIIERLVEAWVKRW